MFWSMRRMTARIGAFESPDLGGPSRYLKHILLSSRKFLGTSEVEEFSQNEQNLKSSFEISRWIFEKFFNNVFFLASKLIYASYDHKN